MVHLKEEPFGTAKKFTWVTDTGFSVSVISYGAIITSINVPDKNGEAADVVLGFDDLESYLKRNKPYLGATVGRYANRIGGAKFSIDGTTYQVTKNLVSNHLHGGLKGFDKVNWTPTVDGTKVIFSYLSADGEEGYPGTVLTSVSYEVTEDQSLHVEFQSVTTRKTIVNLTNHSYFNLAGHDAGAEQLYEHWVTINADKITATDADAIPTGGFVPVGTLKDAGISYDFRSPRKLGGPNAMNNGAATYDDNFCISTYGNKGLNFMSRVTHPPSGRYMDLYSDKPGVQFYTGNYLPAPNEPALIGKAGVGYRKHGAFCLEPQNYPDAVNHANFPSPILKPGDVYTHKVKYSFGAQKEWQPTVVSN